MRQKSHREHTSVHLGGHEQQLRVDGASHITSHLGMEWTSLPIRTQTHTCSATHTQTVETRLYGHVCPFSEQTDSSISHGDVCVAEIEN